MIRDLLAHVSREDLRLRFFDSMMEFSPQFIAGLIDIGGLPVTALVAEIGYQGQALGWDLMQLIIEYAKSEGLSRIDGQILQENPVMLKMCRELGFEVKTDAEDRGVCNVALMLEDY